MSYPSAPNSGRKTRERRPPRPLDKERLNELALSYLARFATSAAKLEAYLRRKLRERGWEGESDPPISAIVERCVGAGYVDDAAYARSKAGSLRRRGYGERRVDQTLNAAGIAADLREDVRGTVIEERAAALALAKKRRLGPFGPPLADRQAREKQIAVLLRAGHRMDIARQVLMADTIARLEAWAEEEE